MSDCCSTQCETNHGPAKLDCPACDNKSLKVSHKTMLQHIQSPWQHSLSDRQFYFCNSPACDVVYFSDDGVSFDKSDIRVKIGVKEEDNDALICFCFGVNKTQAATDKQIKEFVMRQTKQALCACETANPSGRCCLKDFAKFKQP
ncbi:MAG: hypothetical protein OEY11_15275 [Gammaproteobacteria bacterium]|nr:hypothetical protein [Gammaproteobacteria bacterium]